MNKSKLYKIGALCLTFLGAGTFMAFDDAQTDEQKVETAYQQLVTDFNMEQEQLCKTQALAAAQAHWTALQNEGSEASGGNTVVTTTTGGGSSQGTTTTTTTGGNDEPTTTTKPTPTTGKKGKMSGSKDASVSDKKGKMSGDSKSETGTSSTDKKKNKMGKK